MTKEDKVLCLDTLMPQIKDNFPYLSKHEDQLLKCLKCGTCLSVCPIYAELKYEPASARGRMALIQQVFEGNLDLTDLFKKKINFCLNCKSCVEGCPGGVKVDDLILAARAELVNRGKLTILERLIFRHLLKRGRLLPPVGRMAVFMGNLAQKILPEKSPINLFLPLPQGFKQRIFPKIDRKPLRKRVPQIIKVENPKLRVGYFYGCGTNLVYPQVGEAMIKVLAHNDIEVVVPKGQICCGTSIYNSGDFKTGIKHARKNLKVFRDARVDCIVVNCASCGLTLKKEYKDLLGVDFDIPVYDISEFLIDKIEMKKDFKKDLNYTVVYHDPCHLNRGQAVKTQPRKILKMIPGLKFVDMKNADRCCGGGGSFHLKYYPTSEKIMDYKVAEIEKLDPDFLVTGCPGCMMRFQEAFLIRKIRTKIVHTVELVAWAYGD